LAKELGLDGALRGAAEDEFGLYTASTLRITVRPQRMRKENNILAGTYTYGHIVLYPCPRCNVAFLTTVYLHELVHAWVHEYRPRQVYDRWNACTLADKFSAQAFKHLGGSVSRRPTHPLCQKYSLSIDIALSRVTQISKLFTRISTEIPNS
jgi:hypothetical protein